MADYDMPKKRVKQQLEEYSLSMYDLEGPFDRVVESIKSMLDNAKTFWGNKDKPIALTDWYVNRRIKLKVWFDTFTLTANVDHDGYFHMYVVGHRDIMPEEFELMEEQSNERKKHELAELKRLKKLYKDA